MRVSRLLLAVLACSGGRIVLVAAISLTGSMPVLAQRPKSKKKADAAPPTVQMRLWVPAYYYPFGPGLRKWNRLIASAKAVPIVAIVNPASGPGDHVDTNFAAIIPRARKAGLTLVGYIGTQYTRKPLAQVKREVETFLTFYPDLQGFHFDEQSSDARGVDYYAELYRYVHQRIDGAIVLTNPGTTCDRGYAARPASDVISLFENERGFDALPATVLDVAISRLEVLRPGTQRQHRGADEEIVATGCSP